MGLFDALTTAVSGLQAQSFAMQNISGNIANSQTTAYKGIETNFRGSHSGGLSAHASDRRRRDCEFARDEQRPGYNSKHDVDD